MLALKQGKMGLLTPACCANNRVLPRQAHSQALGCLARPCASMQAAFGMAEHVGWGLQAGNAYHVSSQYASGKATAEAIGRGLELEVASVTQEQANEVCPKAASCLLPLTALPAVVCLAQCCANLVLVAPTCC